VDHDPSPTIADLGLVLEVKGSLGPVALIRKEEDRSCSKFLEKVKHQFHLHLMQVLCLQGHGKTSRLASCITSLRGPPPPGVMTDVPPPDMGGGPCFSFRFPFFVDIATDLGTLPYIIKFQYPVFIGDIARRSNRTGGSSMQLADAATNDKRRGHATWWSRVGMLLMLPLISVGGYFSGVLLDLRSWNANRPTDAMHGPGVVNGLRIDPASLDIEDVWEDPAYELHVALTNVGSQPRVISHFSLSCGCLTIEPDQLTIEPGETRNMTLHVNLTHRQPYQIGMARWTVAARFQPIFQDDLASSQGWDVRIGVLSRVNFDTWQIAFGDRATHSGPAVEHLVKAHSLQPLRRLEARVEPDVATVRVESVRGSETDYVLKVSPHPELPVGPFHGQIITTAVGKDGQVCRCATIPFSGEMQSATRLLPQIILLGERSLGSSAEATVTVLLPRTPGWDVDHIESDDPHTDLKRLRESHDGGIRFLVRQQIMAPGDHVTRVRFVLRRPDGVQDSAGLEVRYYGQK
jgi:hypothetical protein